MKMKLFLPFIFRNLLYYFASVFYIFAYFFMMGLGSHILQCFPDLTLAISKSILNFVGNKLENDNILWTVLAVVQKTLLLYRFFVLPRIMSFDKFAWFL